MLSYGKVELMDCDHLNDIKVNKIGQSRSFSLNIYVKKDFANWQLMRKRTIKMYLFPMYTNCFKRGITRYIRQFVDRKCFHDIL